MTDYSLYLVTSSEDLPPGATVESTVREAVRAGVKIVQLREKNLSTKLFLERARALREICQPPVKLIINDRIDIAHACGADGVHLGQDDMPLLDAQKLFQATHIIGISVNTIEEAITAVRNGATYLGVGTCWPTGTKLIPEHKIIGPRGVKAIRDELDRLGLSVPLVVIGGINSTNLIRTLYGCTSNRFYANRDAESPIGVAVVSAIMKSPDPYQSTQYLKELIEACEGWLRTPEENIDNPHVRIQLKLVIAMLKFQTKTSTPLIHHITNTVVQNDCANLVLAYGCSPIMSSNPSEMEDLIKVKGGSLVLNLGTFDDHQVHAMRVAGWQANLTGKPVIFDPVGVGASQERKKKARELLNTVQMSVIKGNQAEIATLARFSSSGVSSCGVDSNGEVEAPDLLVKHLARQELCVVVMTGKTDWISDGKHVFRLDNGVSDLSGITGSGCMIGTSIGCFASMTQPDVDRDTRSGLLSNLTDIHHDLGDILIASILGISMINVVAEMIHETEKENSEYGPLSLKTKIMDHITKGRKNEHFWRAVHGDFKMHSEFFHDDEIRQILE
ncbi:hypothetical protein PTTG_28038 [Puccinia triticina 1-1 BBBD Race 1]|uniref:4-methyl-5-beta-hydroxyethylthiazole kinase n=1 Tax=Puccinia triticina (isolate 1-1 / race 1 (BBBD)) TaxID=630390 RepID=A0A180GEZ8_PUCT1|nr:hypothetical protein PTTG_28038 [Puccinia triticina 1-1 BBBD Race 1]